MDEILHHLRNHGSHCFLVFAGESSFHSFLSGAGLCPSTVSLGSLKIWAWQAWPLVVQKWPGPPQLSSASVRSLASTCVASALVWFLHPVSPCHRLHKKCTLCPRQIGNFNRLGVRNNRVSLGLHCEIRSFLDLPLACLVRGNWG